MPIFKADDPEQFSNYRPVSVLPVLSKVLERLVYNRIVEFISKNNILYDFQFGFREKHSCDLALITLSEKIIQAIENNKYCIGVFLDLSKAFDTMDHEILLQKLYQYGFRGPSLTWIRNYLEDRGQFVIYNNAKSQTQKIKCGVPQGSILGPLLFLLYMNGVKQKK